MSRKPYEWRYRAKASEELLQFVSDDPGISETGRSVILNHLGRVRDWEGFRRDDDALVDIQINHCKFKCAPEVAGYIVELEKEYDNARVKLSKSTPTIAIDRILYLIQYFKKYRRLRDLMEAEP